MKRTNENEFIKTNMVLHDRGHWRNIDGKFRDLIIEMRSIRYIELDFPKDVNNRHLLMKELKIGRILVISLKS